MWNATDSCVQWLAQYMSWGAVQKEGEKAKVATSKSHLLFLVAIVPFFFLYSLYEALNSVYMKSGILTIKKEPRFLFYAVNGEPYVVN